MKTQLSLALALSAFLATSANADAVHRCHQSAAPQNVLEIRNVDSARLVHEATVTHNGQKHEISPLWRGLAYTRQGEVWSIFGHPPLTAQTDYVFFTSIGAKSVTWISGNGSIEFDRCR